MSLPVVLPIVPEALPLAEGEELPLPRVPDALPLAEGDEPPPIVPEVLPPADGAEPVLGEVTELLLPGDVAELLLLEGGIVVELLPDVEPVTDPEVPLPVDGEVLLDELPDGRPLPLVLLLLPGAAVGAIPPGETVLPLPLDAAGGQSVEPLVEPLGDAPLPLLLPVPGLEPLEP